MDDEVKEKIQRLIGYCIPIAVILLLFIVSIMLRKNIKEMPSEKAPVIDMTTEEEPMEIESINNASLYLKNIEDGATVMSSGFELYDKCKTTISGSKFTNYGKQDIIFDAEEGKNNIDYFEGKYSIYGDDIDKCLFRIIPDKKKATFNKYQYMGVDYNSVNMHVGTAECDEVDIQYKKAIYIVNQKGMFYIHFELNDENMIEQLGFKDIDITARLQPYNQETDDCVANITCYITKNGFEFYSDIPLNTITLDRDTYDLSKWKTITINDVNKFIFNGKEFMVDGEKYDKEWSNQK